MQTTGGGKQRNPLVRLALFRRAGPHARSGKARRQAAKRALRRELAGDGATSL